MIIDKDSLAEEYKRKFSQAKAITQRLKAYLSDFKKSSGRGKFIFTLLPNFLNKHRQRDIQIKIGIIYRNTDEKNQNIFHFENLTNEGLFFQSFIRFLNNNAEQIIEFISKDVASIVKEEMENKIKDISDVKELLEITMAKNLYEEIDNNLQK